MLLEVDQYYVDENGTTVIQGALTSAQEAWWNENSGKPIDEITHLTLTPAQELYIALCQNGFHLKKALKSCGFKGKKAAEAQQVLKIRDDDGIVTEITRPSFVGADLQGADLRGADLRRANLYKAQMQGAVLRETDLRWAFLWKAKLQEADLRRAKLQGAFLRAANLYKAQMQGADLRRANLYEALLRHADLRGADLQDAEMQRAKLDGSDISGANFKDAKNLNTADLNLAFYCQDNPPKNLAEALNGVDANKRPMALTKQEYDNVCRLRNSNNRSAFHRDLDRLRGVCNDRIDSREQVDAAVNAAKAKFAWCKPLVSTKVAIMFSQGFDAQTRAAWYGEDAGGKVLQRISNRLEFLNHLVGRGSR